jgi:hypothetical protein
VNSSEEEQERIISGRSVPETILEEEEVEEEGFHVVGGFAEDSNDKRKCKYRNLFLSLKKKTSQAKDTCTVVLIIPQIGALLGIHWIGALLGIYWIGALLGIHCGLVLFWVSIGLVLFRVSIFNQVPTARPKSLYIHRETLNGHKP